MTVFWNYITKTNVNLINCPAGNAVEDVSLQGSFLHQIYQYIISVHLTEIQRGGSGDFTEHGDKVTGVGKSGSSGNVLDLHIRSGKQQFPGTADAVHGNVLVNRTAHKTAEQTGKILGRDKNTLTQLGSRDILLITGFDFFYYRDYVSLVERIILYLRRSCTICKIHKKVVAVGRKRFHIRCGLMVFAQDRRDHLTDTGPLLLFDEDHFLIVSHGRDAACQGPCEGGKHRGPGSGFPVVGMWDTWGDENPLVGSESIEFSTDLDAAGAFFGLEIMIVRISVRTEDINLIPVVPKRFKHKRSTDRSISEIDRHDIHLFLNVIYFGETYYTIIPGIIL